MLIKRIVNHLIWRLKIGIFNLSKLFPRDDHKWIFGEGDNARFLFLKALNNEENIKCYWICRRKREYLELRKRQPNTYYRYSWRGIYHLLTAKVYFYTVSIRYINLLTAGNVTRFNLWHGVGLKKMGFIDTINRDTCYFKKDIKSRFMLRLSDPHYLLSTSAVMTDHFSKCFGIPTSRCVEALYPRNEVFKWSKEELEEFIHAHSSQETEYLLHKIKRYKKSYIYLPTWRDNGVDFTVDFDLERLNQVMAAKESLFVFRFHPKTRIDLSKFQGYSNISVEADHVDLYALLPYIDVLITDYSSVYFDFILMDKEVILFPFDEKEYTADCRSFALDYKKYTIGHRVYTFQKLIEVIESELDCHVKDKELMLKTFWESREVELMPILVKMLKEKRL